MSHVSHVCQEQRLRVPAYQASCHTCPCMRRLAIDRPSSTYVPRPATWHRLSCSASMRRGASAAWRAAPPSLTFVRTALCPGEARALDFGYICACLACMDCVFTTINALMFWVQNGGHMPPGFPPEATPPHTNMYPHHSGAPYMHGYPPGDNYNNYNPAFAGSPAAGEGPHMPWQEKGAASTWPRAQNTPRAHSQEGRRPPLHASTATSTVSTITKMTWGDFQQCGHPACTGREFMHIYMLPPFPTFTWYSSGAVSMCCARVC